MIFLNWIGWSSRSHQFGYHKKVGKFFRLKNWNQCRNCFPVTFLYDSFLSLVFSSFFLLGTIELFVSHYELLWNFTIINFFVKSSNSRNWISQSLSYSYIFLNWLFKLAIYIFVCRFFRLTIRVQWEEIVKGELTAFMTSVGRMKFCRPLYQWVDVFLILFICESKLHLWFWKLLLNAKISEF